MRAIDRLQVNVVEGAVQDGSGQGLSPLPSFRRSPNEPIDDPNEILQRDLAFHPSSRPDRLSLSLLDCHTHTEEGGQGSKHFGALEPTQISKSVAEGFVRGSCLSRDLREIVDSGWTSEERPVVKGPPPLRAQVEASVVLLREELSRLSQAVSARPGGSILGEAVHPGIGCLREKGATQCGNVGLDSQVAKPLDTGDPHRRQLLGRPRKSERVVKG